VNPSPRSLRIFPRRAHRLDAVFSALDAFFCRADADNSCLDALPAAIEAEKWDTGGFLDFFWKFL
ncbi:MAG: hypothetical protein Q4E49_05740, partial [Bacteroidales bacterium]|nr:hypothetical protein [Bacteroidales bacterium]